MSGISNECWVARCSTIVFPPSLFFNSLTTFHQFTPFWISFLFFYFSFPLSFYFLYLSFLRWSLLEFFLFSEPVSVSTCFIDRTIRRENFHARACSFLSFLQPIPWYRAHRCVFTIESGFFFFFSFLFLCTPGCLFVLRRFEDIRDGHVTTEWSSLDRVWRIRA